MTRSMPAAEVEVRADLVKRLLSAQHPDLAHLPVRALTNGWDNALFRLGEDLIVRLPRRAAAARLTMHEQRWLPGLAARLPLPIPAPVRTGHPDLGYRWAWSVVPFLPGQIAALTPPADPGDAARGLGRFLAALHAPAPADAPDNPVRGGPLAGREQTDLGNLDILDGVDRAAVLRVHRTALNADAWSGPPVWLHGDLHPANVLVDAGRISAVIDFGDLTSGDPATDLSLAWMLLPAGARADFRSAYGRVDDGALWCRARGWALAFALVFLAHSADNPTMAGIGERTLGAVLGEEG